MNLYEIHFDTGAPHYSDHVADVLAPNEDWAVNKLKDYRWCEFDETIHVYSVMKIK